MKRFKNTLCVVEAAKQCAPMLQRAVSLAKSNQAKLTVVDVVPRISAGIGMPEGGPISAEPQTVLVAGQRIGRSDPDPLCRCGQGDRRPPDARGRVRPRVPGPPPP